MIFEALCHRVDEGGTEAVQHLLLPLQELYRENRSREDIFFIFFSVVNRGRKDIVEHLNVSFRDKLRRFAKGLVSYLMRSKRSDVNDNCVAMAVERLITQDIINVNERYSEGSTLLHYKKANLFARDRTGKMALEAAQQFVTLEDLDKSATNIAGGTYWTQGQISTKIPGYDLHLLDTCWKLLDGKLHLTSSQKISNSEKQIERSKQLFPGSTLLHRIGANVVRNPDSIGRRLSNKPRTFNLPIANGIGYNESAVVSMLQFFSRTFLEQNGAEPRLRFREPSYNSITQSHVTDFPEEEEMIQSSSGKQTQIPVREYGKAGSNTFVNITEGSSETPTDTPSQPVRIIDKTGSSTPVSQASAKCGAVTDNAGAPAKPNVVSIVLPYFHSLSKDGLAFQRLLWSEEGDQNSPGEEGRKANEQQILLNFHEPRTLDESYYTGINYKQLS
ncbi:MAG: hypothetical protein LQ351_004270 [Letrouitia transgressa]|nr:MAG: hypothetical protein LQ351_004270 [Letrouitia transgressa]